jgi:uncharacterized protein (DUF1697 family)
MPTYAAFLRGINVGGHRVTNERLRDLFVVLGFDRAHVFRASGNVVFAAEEERPGQLTARIERGLADSLGYEVATFLRSSEEIRAIAGLQPFSAAQLRASNGKLHVAMLSAFPPAPARSTVLGLSTDSDLLAFGARELYWLPSGGMMESELDLKLIDGLLGPSTRRTKGTVEALAARHFAG